MLFANQTFFKTLDKGDDSLITFITLFIQIISSEKDFVKIEN